MNVNEEMEEKIRLAAIQGLCSRMDDAPRIANLSAAIVRAVSEGLRTGRPVPNEFEKEMSVMVQDGQRIVPTAPSALGPGGPNLSPDALALLQGLGRLMQAGAVGPLPPPSNSNPVQGETRVEISGP